MNRRLSCLIEALALAALMVSGVVLAQAPGPGNMQEITEALNTAFTYQGQLQNSDGPVTGTCDFIFELYETSMDGTPIASVIKNGEQVTDGYFDVALDFGPDAFAGDRRWLGIKVRCANEANYVNLDHQELTPTPYALYALSAGRVPWSGVQAMPAGFADDEDNVVTYTAGTGLMLVGTEFGLTETQRLPQGCGLGQIAKWDTANERWNCGNDDTGAGGDAWSLTGNAGTTPGTNFVGTTDEVNLTLAVSGTPVLRLEPALDLGGNFKPNVIGGHVSNTVAVGLYGATIAGGGSGTSPNRATSNFAAVGGGLNNESGGFASTVGGGWNNEAGGQGAVIGGGQGNVITGHIINGAMIGGGQNNAVSASYGTIAGGQGNQIRIEGAAIGGGYNNTITSTATNATIAGGNSNTARGLFSAIGGGSVNVTGGPHSTIPGGYDNVAQGDFSFAAGRQAKADHRGAFVWGDDTGTDIRSSDRNQFIVRANGGIWLGRATTDLTPTIDSGVFISTSTGAYLSDTGTWVSVSARDRKKNFAPVEGQEILARVVELPITTWNYKTGDDAVRHMGPVAEDFYAAFELGQDGRHIAALDSSGVALAAIQGLHALSQEQATRIDELETENATLRQQLNDLETRMAALEASVDRTNSNPSLTGSPLPIALLIMGIVAVYLNRRIKDLS